MDMKACYLRQAQPPFSGRHNRRRASAAAADMPTSRKPYFIAVLLALGLHAVVIGLLVRHLGGKDRPPPPDSPAETVAVIQVVPARQEPVVPAPPTGRKPRVAPPAPAEPPPPSVATDRAPAFMEAPPAPSAQEWAQAASYTLKNSKRYRHTWGQQVRSMMGTAVEGADQGLVRFQIEIAPDGRLERLNTLWSTSDAAERLARHAVLNMPPLPPTPTGLPLVFEKTISFQPFDAEGPPIYKNDCLPDPPGFANPFAWDGASPQVRAERAPAPPPDPQALQECLKQLPQDSIEAEQAHDRRQLEQWRSMRLGR